MLRRQQPIGSFYRLLLVALAICGTNPGEAASPASGNITPTGPSAPFNGRWVGTGTSSGGSGEGTCVEGAHCDTFRLSVAPGAYTSAIPLEITWAVASNNYDLYLHKCPTPASTIGQCNATAPIAQGTGAKPRSEQVFFDPSATGIGDFTVHVVYVVGGPSDQYRGTVFNVQHGPTFTVNTTNDIDDGVCSAAHCSLREAIQACNSDFGDNTINFAPGLAGTIQLGAALPNVTGNLSVQGPGANLLTVRRNSGGDYRIFTITNGTTTGPVVSLTGITINNGKAPTPAPVNGGGILNDHGDLTLTSCVVSGNVATNGAGIFNSGSNGGSAKLTLIACTLSNNLASGFGGAINTNGSQGGSAMVSLTNCTVHANSSTRGSAVHNGGASGSASLTLLNCTLADNSAPFGIYNDGASGSAVVNLSNTILKAAPTSANIANANNAGSKVTSQGHNVSSDNGSGFLTATGDQINTDPLLAPLADNGGPTQTQALQSGSPGINTGDDALAPMEDQRGFQRLGVSDIGAFESGGYLLRLLAIARDGNDIVVTFQTAAGATVRLERTPSLTPPDWSSIPDVPDFIASDEEPATMPDRDALSLGKAFYRLRLLP